MDAGAAHGHEVGGGGLPFDAKGGICFHCDGVGLGTAVCKGTIYQEAAADSSGLVGFAVAVIHGVQVGSQIDGIAAVFSLKLLGRDLLTVKGSGFPALCQHEIGKADRKGSLSFGKREEEAGPYGNVGKGILLGQCSKCTLTL